MVLVHVYGLQSPSGKENWTFKLEKMTVKNNAFGRNVEVNHQESGINQEGGGKWSSSESRSWKHYVIWGLKKDRS